MASQFPIINRRGKRYDWRVYDGSDPIINSLGAIPKAKPPGQLDLLLAVPSSRGHIDADASQTHTSRETAINYFVVGGDCVGPYRLHAGERNVMAPGGAATGVVSVEGVVKSVKSVLNHQSPEETTAGPDKVQKTIQTVSKIIWNVGTGLMSAVASALPGVGSTSSGIAKMVLGAQTNTASVLGSVMLSSFEDTGGDVPKGPTVTDVENALRFVVQEAEARNDGSLFMTAYSGFQEKAEEISALLPERRRPGPDRWRQSAPIARHLLDDIEQSVERALEVENGASFVNRLQYQCSNPETSWFILPQLMVAMGLYLHLKRLHTAIVYLPERLARSQSQIPPAVLVEHMIDKIDDMKSGLSQARASFEAYVGSKLNPTGLAGTPEAVAVIKEITSHYFGDENAVHHQGYKRQYPTGSGFLGQAIPAGPDKVDAAIAELTLIQNHLEQDVVLINSGKWPQHLLDIKFNDVPAGG